MRWSTQNNTFHTNSTVHDQHIPFKQHSDTHTQGTLVARHHMFHAHAKQQQAGTRWGVVGGGEGVGGIKSYHRTIEPNNRHTAEVTTCLNPMVPPTSSWWATVERKGQSKRSLQTAVVGKYNNSMYLGKTAANQIAVKRQLPIQQPIKL